MYGNPIEELNNSKQKDKNIKSNAIEVKIVSRFEEQKEFKKKLLSHMKISALWSMCSKLFKTEIVDFKLSFVQDGEQ